MAHPTRRRRVAHAETQRIAALLACGRPPARGPSYLGDVLLLSVDRLRARRRHGSVRHLARRPDMLRRRRSAPSYPSDSLTDGFHRRNTANHPQRVTYQVGQRLTITLRESTMTDVTPRSVITPGQRYMHQHIPCSYPAQARSPSLFVRHDHAGCRPRKRCRKPGGSVTGRAVDLVPGPARSLAQWPTTACRSSMWGRCCAGRPRGAVPTPRPSTPPSPRSRPRSTRRAGSTASSGSPVTASHPVH